MAKYHEDLAKITDNVVLDLSWDLITILKID